MNRSKGGKKNPKLWLGALVATSVISISYKIYNKYMEGGKKEELETVKGTNRSVALTLSHSVLSSKLPLEEYLMNSDNAVFILPPNLSVEDLLCNFSNAYQVSKILLQNYKLIDCSNIEGYFSLLRNLKPDTLIVCTDDLGVEKMPGDFGRFVKEVITLKQSRDDVQSKVMPLFMRA